MTRSDDRQRGFALLIVLWTLSLLALLGTQLVATSRQHIQLAHNLIDAAALEAAANGAVQQAIFGVLDSSPRHWRPDGSIHVVRLGGAIVAVRAEDEADKVNPNIAAPKLLQALLFQVGADPQTAAAVAASIVEWRLASGSAAKQGMIAARYAAAGRDYAPSGAPFDSLDELGAVLVEPTRRRPRPSDGLHRWRPECRDPDVTVRRAGDGRGRTAPMLTERKPAVCP
jgi:general secretion pathway protein K